MHTTCSQAVGGVQMYSSNCPSQYMAACMTNSSSAAFAQVNGDVFIGRYMDNEEDFERLDFTSADLSSSAPWVAEAKVQIARRSERSGDTQALLQRLQQQEAGAPSSSTSSKAESPADAAKVRGNEVSRTAGWGC